MFTVLNDISLRNNENAFKGCPPPTHAGETDHQACKEAEGLAGAAGEGRRGEKLT